jgi:hypothetical protein
MPRRLLSLTALLLAAAALAGCGYAALMARGHLDIEAAELQARIDKRFPLRQCKLVVACLELAHPSVVLQEGDDRLGLLADITVTVGNRERTGRIGLAARPRYAPETGQLFLDDPEITTLALPGFPEELAGLVKARGADAARQALQQQPVYTLDTATTKGAFAKRAVRDVKVVDGKLRVSFVGSGS